MRGYVRPERSKFTRRGAQPLNGISHSEDHMTASSSRFDSSPSRMMNKACDGCRARRIKVCFQAHSPTDDRECPEGEPCTRCIKAEISCGYLRKPERKGPEGKYVEEQGLLSPVDIHAGS